MKKKYQVFLSSTYQDLIEERALAIQTLLEMDFIPCGMEMFPASDDDQWTLIKKLIDDCDYYIVIVSGLYGSQNNDGKSYTQLEYEYAVQNGKPVIAFLHDKIELLQNNKCETSEIGRKKLNDFKDLCKRKMVKFWNNPQQLVGLINTGLSKLVDSRPAIGWVRTDHINEFQKIADINPQDFFYTLDDRASANFPDIIKGARSVSVLARTAVNLLSQYERQLDELAKTGCTIQFLFIDPNSESIKYVYGSNEDVLKENIRKTNIHLKRLSQKCGDKFNAKCIKHAPTMSLVLIERSNPNENFIIVQLYFLHSRVSRDRPIFKIIASDKWYTAFLDEFNQLWSDAESIVN